MFLMQTREHSKTCVLDDLRILPIISGGRSTTPVEYLSSVSAPLNLETMPLADPDLLQQRDEAVR